MCDSFRSNGPLRRMNDGEAGRAVSHRSRTSSSEATNDQQLQTGTRRPAQLSEYTQKSSEAKEPKKREELQFKKSTDDEKKH